MGVILVLVIRYIVLSQAQPQVVSLRISILSLIFGGFTWLVVVVRQWPDMQVDGVDNGSNCILPISQDGALEVVACFRFYNRSLHANAVLGAQYSLRIEGQERQYQIQDLHLSESSRGQINEWKKETPDLLLGMPEVYPASTARAKYVTFTGRVPWRRQGNEKPRVWLKAQFEMAEGGSEAAEVELKWPGNLPTSLYPLHFFSADLAKQLPISEV